MGPGHLTRQLATVVLLGAVCLAGCSDPPGDPVPGADAPRIHLPRLGTIGALPSGEALVVEADSQGRFTLDGRDGGPRDLVLLLRGEDDGPDRVAHREVLLRLDRRLPWAVARRLLLACAEPTTRLDRVHLAVRSEDGGEEGSVILRVATPRAEIPDGDRLEIHARVLAGGPGSEPAILGARVREILRVEPTMPGRVSADGLASLGAVLSAADACRRAGTRTLDLVVTPDEHDGASVADLVCRATTTGGTATIVLLGETLGAEPLDTASPAPRVREAFLGTLRPGLREDDLLVRDGPVPEPAPLTEADLDPPVVNGGMWIRDEEITSVRTPEELRAVLAFADAADTRIRVRTPARSPAPGVEGAVGLGLDWLHRHQSPPGCWNCDGFAEHCRLNRCDGGGDAAHDVGVTGLAALAFLGAGETHRAGTHRATVRSALVFLKRHQDPEGCFGGRTPYRFVYDHACAALAMTEAYRLTGSPLFRRSAQGAVNFIERCRNPYLAWRYGIRPQDNDTSVTGWMVLVLASAKRGGLRVPTEAFEGAAAWIEKATEPEYGVVGYTVRGKAARYPEWQPARQQRTSLTAVGVLVRCLLGESPATSEMIQKGAEICLTSLPEWDAGTTDLSYWLHGTLAMRRVGGDAWRAWNVALKTALVDQQRKDGDERGSWDPVGRWGAVGGRVYATAAATICLEARQGLESHLARPDSPPEPGR